MKLYRSQLTINTSIVYMHRFYMLNSFTKFHRNVSMLKIFLFISVSLFDLCHRILIGCTGAKCNLIVY